MGLVRDGKVAARLGVHKQTLKRWDKDPDLNFPPPIVINGYRYRDDDAIEAFIAERLKRSISAENVRRGKEKAKNARDARKRRQEQPAGEAAA